MTEISVIQMYVRIYVIVLLQQYLYVHCISHTDTNLYSKKYSNIHL